MKTMTITERALAARINRKLWRTKQASLKKMHEGRRFAEYGPYYIVENNTITDYGITDLEALAKEVGVLAPYEQLEACGT